MKQERMVLFYLFLFFICFMATCIIADASGEEGLGAREGGGGGGGGGVLSRSSLVLTIFNCPPM